MALRKIKKRKKKSRMRGSGTHGWGARKKHKKSGHKGGGGMSGSGKRGDHKKTLITKLYGHEYFGKKGITSKGTKPDKRKRINIKDIDQNPEKFGKKTGEKWEINLNSYKVLGSSNGKIKNKLIIKAKEASKQALEKVKKAGGEIILSGKEGSKLESEDIKKKNDKSQT